MTIRSTTFIFCFVLLLGAFFPGEATPSPISQISKVTPDEIHLQGFLPPLESTISGPFIETTIATESGSTQTGPLTVEGTPEFSITPLRYIPGQEPKGSALPDAANWIDPVLQDISSTMSMPGSVMNFPGMSKLYGGSGYPPDTVGDVGQTHYVQAVNTSIAVYDKNTGIELLRQTFNEFFTGPAGTPCDSNNQGDPVVLYDPVVNRWLISDFAWVGSYLDGGPYYECIAVSTGENPVTSGWYFYALRADSGDLVGYLNDYPKLGVWADGWYMTANMFRINSPNPNDFVVRVWALDRDAMIVGNPMTSVYFDLCQYNTCDSLLPATLHGDLPPLNSPEYLLSAEAPDVLNLWKFSVDWNMPTNSTFTGPFQMNAAPFAIGSSVPQPGFTSRLLDSLSYRLMMQLQYRNVNGREALWVNHSVGTSGKVGVRWYEVNGLQDVPYIAQQGTYLPDATYRWMGSLAIDRDGNMAVGYSVSSTTTYPGIRYAGRLDGEEPGLLTQDEAVMFPGSGSQLTYTRWGDYSSMTIDPVDDCTFWYTNEYYLDTGTNWQTRIGAFRFPSCGKPKGMLSGKVRNAVTLQPVSDAWITAQSHSLEMTFRLRSDDVGYFSMMLPSGTYTVTAGPLLPGYPLPWTVENVSVIADTETNQDLFLQPVSYLEGVGTKILDEDGYVVPGEVDVPLLRLVENTGAITATMITSHLMSLTEGVQVKQAQSTYPEAGVGNIITNTLPYVISVSPAIPCGADLSFKQVITDTYGSYQNQFSLNAAVPLPRQNLLYNTVETPQTGWTTGGVNNYWGVTEKSSYSPTHAWTDSPSGDYANNTNSYLRSTSFNLIGKRSIQVSGWISYTLETGWDFAYLDYSLDGGLSWQPNPLVYFNGHSSWTQFNVSVPQADDQPSVAIRMRLVSDGSVTKDGIYLDDLLISYESYACEGFKFYLPLVYKNNIP
jgi:hypothetical protein